MGFLIALTFDDEKNFQPPESVGGWAYGILSLNSSKDTDLFLPS